MSKSDPVPQRGNVEIQQHAEAALRVTRIVLGVLACCAIGSFRPLSGSQRWGSIGLTIVAIIASVAFLNWLSRASSRRPGLAISICMQALDVVAIVALAIALDGPLDRQSWVLLVVPVVSSAVRHGTAASLIAWLGTVGGYIAAVLAGAVNQSDTVALVVRIPGSTLAVAITIGLLARWMKEGWLIQNELTDDLKLREHRLAVVEQTRDALEGLSIEQAQPVVLARVWSLGFAAVSIDHVTRSGPTKTIGDQSLIAEVEGTPAIEAGEIVSTTWMKDSVAHSHSVSVSEPQTASVISAWSATPIDSHLTEAFARLIANASSAIESSTLLTQLRETATLDGLTGLMNRRALDVELEVWTQKPGQLSLLFIDLDDFKMINDTHGHDAGDRVLIATARRIEAIVQDTGMVARFGGDEFVVLLPDATVDVARQVATELLQTPKNVVAFGLTTLPYAMTIGIGHATTPCTVAELMSAADTALYAAKEAGKGTFGTVALDPSPETPALADTQIGLTGATEQMVSPATNSR